MRVLLSREYPANRPVGRLRRQRLRNLGASPSALRIGLFHALADTPAGEQSPPRLDLAPFVRRQLAEQLVGQAFLLGGDLTGDGSRLFTGSAKAGGRRDRIPADLPRLARDRSRGASTQHSEARARRGDRACRQAGPACRQAIVDHRRDSRGLRNRRVRSCHTARPAPQSAARGEASLISPYRPSLLRVLYICIDKSECRRPPIGVVFWPSLVLF